MMEPVLQIVVSLAADGQVGINADGPVSDNPAVIAWLLRTAEQAVLEKAAREALAETASPIVTARLLPPLPPLPPNGAFRR